MLTSALVLFLFCCNSYVAANVMLTITRLLLLYFGEEG